jgi:hypothetical protein
MSISEIGKKINTTATLVTFIIILIGFASFGLGRLSAQESVRPEIKFHPDGMITTNNTAIVNDGRKITDEVIEERMGENEKDNDTSQQMLYVGSKNSDKYHYPWCSGALRIKDDNKIWFSSLEEAKDAGYTPAGNCPGL